MTTTRIATIRCPKCATEITIRDGSTVTNAVDWSLVDIAMKEADKAWAQADRAWAAVEKSFNSIFKHLDK